VTDRWLFTPGVHLLYYTLTGKPSFERGWNIIPVWEERQHKPGVRIACQTHTLATYFLELICLTGSLWKRTGIWIHKVAAVVLGHDWNIKETLRLKTEIYYQYMYDVPVESHPSYSAC